MSPRPNIAAERRQQIFRAAMDCFYRKGFHLTTMDDIVVESGLSKGTLYWYFPSKKELFLSLFQEAFKGFESAWQQIIDQSEASATEKMKQSVALFRTEFEDMVPFMGIMMEAWALTRHDEDVASATRQVYQPYLDAMARIVREGAASGEFSVRSPEATALIIMTLFDGVMLALGTGLAADEWGSLMDAAEAMVLRGVGVN